MGSTDPMTYLKERWIRDGGLACLFNFTHIASLM
jgi:hypothetical protein